MATYMLSQGRRGVEKLWLLPWSCLRNRTPVRFASGLYYVLLPEIPPDTTEDNAVMQFHQTPKFSVISPDACVTGCAKLAIQYETALGNHIDSLKDPKEEKSFNRVFECIEQVTVPLNTAWRTAKNLNYVAGSQQYRQAFQRIHPQVERAKNERWISETLYYVCKELAANDGNLSEFQRRLVALYLLEGRLNGVELQGKDKRVYISTLKIVNRERGHFRNRVMLCQGMFSHRITDFGAVAEMPRKVLSVMAEDSQNPSHGPWRVTLQHSIYKPFLEYCSDRTLRWNAWNAYNNRASHQFENQNLGNHKQIEEIRIYRRNLAELLGFDNFAQMSMETKMAGSVENVLNMIETLKGKFQPHAEEEVAALEKFAESEGFKDRLQMWDLYYWQRRHREHMYNLDDHFVAEHFPLETVLEGLFNLCNFLFGITIQERTGEVETWHQDVRFFELFDKNGHRLSSFFFDPFSRPADKLSGVWMEMGRERSELMDSVPYSFLVLNLLKPMSNSVPVLMQFGDVLALFHEFGHGLQQLLTKVPYSELAGQRNVEWDAVKVCACFMQNWLLEPSFLHKLSRHHSTGQPLPADVLSRVLASHHHMSGYNNMRQLYFSAYDMEIYVSKNHWHSAMGQVWKQYMPLPLDKEDNHPCSFTHIFSDQFPAAYYSNVWSQMIAADLFAAFRESGLHDADKMRALGERFRDTFLSLGGGVPASEVFRRFRGRDPSLDAFQDHVVKVGK